MEESKGFQKCRAILMKHPAVIGVKFESHVEFDRDSVEIVAKCWSEEHQQRLEVGFLSHKDTLEYDDVVEKYTGYIIDEVDRQLRIGPN